MELNTFEVCGQIGVIEERGHSVVLLRWPRCLAKIKAEQVTRDDGGLLRSSLQS
jgi:hypothetical protein